MKSQESFIFTLKSNGRINGMMKFEEKSNSSGFYMYDKSNNGLLFYTNGGIYIYTENNKTSSNIYAYSESYYDYHGKFKSLHPSLSNGSYAYFTPKRFTVIQMQ